MFAFTVRPSPILRCVAPLGAFAAIVLLWSGCAWASINDDFETYTAGNTVAGDTYTPPGGGTNNWSVGTYGTATVTDDGTAYSGNNYLRLGDTSSSTATAAYDKFLSSPESPNGTLDISFALRLSSTFNQENAIFYGYESGGTPSTPTALELGLVGNSGGTEAEVDWYTGGTISGGTSGAGTKNVSGYGTPTITFGHWYLFNVTAGGADAGNGYTPTYAFTVTDETTSTQVLSESGLEATALGSAYDNISEFSVQTSSTGVGNSDLDDFAITDVAAPEPASLAVVMVGGVALRRRRSRRKMHQ